MPLANIDPSINLDTYEPKDNEVMIYVPMCNTVTGLFYGLAKKLGMIILHGDTQDRLFSYGYSKKKRALLYCSMKALLPNVFTSTCFQIHKQLLLDQNELGIKQSDIFFFLSGTLDGKEDFLQWKGNVHLHPIDLSIDGLKNEMSLSTFDPSLLDNKQLRVSLVPGLYKVMKKVPELSNQNLICNSHTFISKGGKVDVYKEFVWIDDSMNQAALKFQLNY